MRHRKRGKGTALKKLTPHAAPENVTPCARVLFPMLYHTTTSAVTLARYVKTSPGETKPRGLRTPASKQSSLYQGRQRRRRTAKSLGINQTNYFPCVRYLKLIMSGSACRRQNRGRGSPSLPQQGCAAHPVALHLQTHTCHGQRKGAREDKRE